MGYYGHTAVWLNGLVYVGGGRNSASTGTIQAEKSSYIINCYDPVNNSWSLSINAPYCLFAMTTLNNRLVTVGGEDNSGKKTNQILTMDADQLKIYSKMMTIKSCTTAAGHKEVLIIMGGKDDRGKELSTVELFDSNNEQWYMCNDLSYPSSRLQSVIVDNILYLVAEGSRGYNFSNILTAPLDTPSTHQLKWNCYQNTLRYASGLMCVNGKHLLIIERYGDNIHKFNKVSHSWEAIGRLPLAREGSAAVSTADNRVIVIGGMNINGVTTNTVWIGSCEPQ